MRLGFLWVLILCAIPLFLASCGGTGTGQFGSILNTPVITMISPSSVAAGNNVTISGENFNGTGTTAYFVPNNGGGTSATSAATSGAANGTSVVVPVPGTLAQGTYNVYVITSDNLGDTSNASNSITISVT